MGVEEEGEEDKEEKEKEVRTTARVPPLNKKQTNKSRTPTNPVLIWPFESPT